MSKKTRVLALVAAAAAGLSALALAAERHCGPNDMLVDCQPHCCSLGPCARCLSGSLWPGGVSPSPPPQAGKLPARQRRIKFIRLWRREGRGEGGDLLRSGDSTPTLALPLKGGGNRAAPRGGGSIPTCRDPQGAKRLFHNPLQGQYHKVDVPRLACPAVHFGAWDKHGLQASRGTSVMKQSLNYMRTGTSHVNVRSTVPHGI